MPLMGIFGSKKNDDNEPVKLPDNKEPIATNDLLLSEEQRESVRQLCPQRIAEINNNNNNGQW